MKILNLRWQCLFPLQAWLFGCWNGDTEVFKLFLETFEEENKNLWASKTRSGSNPIKTVDLERWGRSGCRSSPTPYISFVPLLHCIVERKVHISCMQQKLKLWDLEAIVDWKATFVLYTTFRCRWAANRIFRNQFYLFWIIWSKKVFVNKLIFNLFYLEQIIQSGVSCFFFTF